MLSTIGVHFSNFEYLTERINSTPKIDSNVLNMHTNQPENHLSVTHKNQLKEKE